jgi:hypothetical protein
MSRKIFLIVNFFSDHAFMIDAGILLLMHMRMGKAGRGALSLFEGPSPRWAHKNII